MSHAGFDTTLNAQRVQVVGGTVTATSDTELTTADLDTGAGTDTRAVAGIVGAKSGGGVLIPGDATKGLAVDLTATGANTNALKTEQQFSYGRVTADGQIKGSAGFIHSITIAGLTATPTAGLVTIYDSLTETGTAIYAEWVFATDVGHTIILDVVASTGIYVGYDATLANVQVTVAYR